MVIDGIARGSRAHAFAVPRRGPREDSPMANLMLSVMGAFAEFERAMIRERIMAGLRRTTKKSGRKPMPDDRVEAIRKSLMDGQGRTLNELLTAVGVVAHVRTDTTVNAFWRSQCVL